MNRCEEAIARLMDATRTMHDAEREARNILKKVLLPVGEHGATVNVLGNTEGEFVVLAEENPCEFKPVTLVRYNVKHDKLEVFVSEWEKRFEVIAADGRWVDYENAHVDTHFLIDVVMQNLEYADYYDEDE